MSRRQRQREAARQAKSAEFHTWPEDDEEPDSEGGDPDLQDWETQPWQLPNDQSTRG